MSLDACDIVHTQVAVENTPCCCAPPLSPSDHVHRFLTLFGLPVDAQVQGVYGETAVRGKRVTAQEASHKLLQLGAHLLQRNECVVVGDSLGSKRKVRKWEVWATVWDGVLGRGDWGVQTLAEYRAADMETSKGREQTWIEVHGAGGHAQRAARLPQPKMQCPQSSMKTQT